MAEPSGRPQRKRWPTELGGEGRVDLEGEEALSALPAVPDTNEHRAAVPSGCARSQRGTAAISRSLRSNKNTDKNWHHMAMLSAYNVITINH